MWITKKLEEGDFYFHDVSFVIERHLLQSGYESKLLQKENAEEKEFEKDFVNYLLERKNLQGLTD